MRTKTPKNTKGLAKNSNLKTSEHQDKPASHISYDTEQHRYLQKKKMSFLIDFAAAEKNTRTGEMGPKSQAIVNV